MKNFEKMLKCSIEAMEAAGRPKIDEKVVKEWVPFDSDEFELYAMVEDSKNERFYVAYRDGAERRLLRFFDASHFGGGTQVSCDVIAQSEQGFASKLIDEFIEEKGISHDIAKTIDHD